MTAGQASRRRALPDLRSCKAYAYAPVDEMLTMYSPNCVFEIIWSFSWVKYIIGLMNV
jgi:hypothetical protein